MIISGINPCFGQNLRQLRLQRRLSQKALSAAVGVSVYSIRGWEQGRLTPQIDDDILRRLCCSLTTTPEALFAEG